MTNPPSTGHEILQAVRALLRLASTSRGTLSVSQLLVMEDSLRETLAVISAEIRDKEPGMFSRLFSSAWQLIRVSQKATVTPLMGQTLRHCLMKKTLRVQVSHPIPPGT
jgi:hypothetical protein